MFNKLEILNMAQGMATHSAARQSVLARNIAHADTPGYRAQDLHSFSETYQQQGFTSRRTRSGHLLANDSASERPTFEAAALSKPNGNNVHLEQEMMKGVETKRQHDMALAIYKTSLGILRSSIGR